MIPASFEYHRPESIAQALELLDRFGDDAKLMSGGYSLIPTMKLRLNQPKQLIDLAGIGEMKGIAVEDGHLRVGAFTTHWQVESSPVVKAAFPVLTEVAGVIADPQVRNRGTMGGSISNADPAADYPASIMAFDAELTCVSSAGERKVKGADWFVGLFTTDLAEGEIVRQIRFPLLPPRTAAAYMKLPHPASRFAVVGVAVALSLDEAGTCKDLRIGVTGVNTHAFRASKVEQALIGQKIDGPAIAAASEAACEDLEIGGDLHFSVQDKEQLCRVYVERAVTLALTRAQAGQFQGPQPS